MKILVTRDIYKEYQDRIESYGYDVLYSQNKVLSDEDLKDVEIVLGTLNKEYIKKMPNLKYIHLSTAGSDNIAFLEEVKDKVILTNSTGGFSDSIAEWVIAMIYFFYKKIGDYYLNQKDHIYKNLGETKSLIDSKVLIIGCGSIGLACAKRLKALGSYIVGIKRTAGEKPEYVDEMYTTDKTDELIGDADIIVMAMPQNDETRHFMDESRLKLIKEDSLLINVGRGSAIDTKALIPLLKEKKFNAALDVHEIEPLSKDSELWDMENVFVTPHATGNETMAYTRKVLCDLMIENLDAYMNHRPLKNVVDFKTGYKVSNT
ncbi:MAG: D-2-hydroxyacid dehydrogenase [Erysipelotrichaceae bacterium]|nr:D-2-hydroxyacid dehydrogenase [Erysipelotrichaceae bacterium]